VNNSNSSIISKMNKTIKKQQQQQPERNSNMSSSLMTPEDKATASLLSLSSSHIIRVRTVWMIFMAMIVAVVVRQFSDSNLGFHMTVPLSNVYPVESEFPFVVEFNPESRIYTIWNQIYQFCNFDRIRQNQDWMVWSTALYTASLDSFRAVMSNVIFLVITTKYILQMIRYILLRIVFPHGTKVMNTYILPQLYTQCYYVVTQVILFHSHLTNGQLLYELLGIACSIVFYYYCVPYLIKLRPILRKLFRSYTQSIQKVREMCMLQETSESSER
jgi:hypothetical protein